MIASTAVTKPSTSGCSSNVPTMGMALLLLEEVEVDLGATESPPIGNAPDTSILLISLSERRYLRGSQKWLSTIKSLTPLLVVWVVCPPTVEEGALLVLVPGGAVGDR